MPAPSAMARPAFERCKEASNPNQRWRLGSRCRIAQEASQQFDGLPNHADELVVKGKHAETHTVHHHLAVVRAQRGVNGQQVEDPGAADFGNLGCGFAALAICTVMFGLISEPVLAFRSGAILTGLTTIILFWKARSAPRTDYRDTELWILLERKPELPEAYAGRVITGILSEVYMRHAEAAAAIAFVLWLVSLVTIYTI